MKRILFCLSIIIPPLILGFLVWRFGVNIPFADQWETPGRLVIEASQDKLTWQQLIRQHNESKTLFPNLLFLSLAKLTGWNTRYEMLITFLLACLVSFNIYRLGKITIDSDWQRWICFSWANLLIFSPTQSENWLWGFQGITFISIVAITTSLVVIFSDAAWITKIGVSSALSAIATFSFANGILCWIIIFPSLWFKSIRDKVRKTWVIFGWLIACSTTVSIYLYDYQRPSDLPSVTQIFTRPVSAFSYYTALLGSPLFPKDLLASQITGAVLAAIFIFFCYFSAKRIEVTNKFIPWLSIGFYALLSAGLTTAGRMSLGIETALSSRYITFATYLTISLIYLFTLAINLRQNHWLKITAGLLAIVFSITYKNNFVAGIDTMARSYYQRVYGKTCLLAIATIKDRECIARQIHPDPNKILPRVKKLDRLGLLQPPLIENIDWHKEEGLENSYLGECTVSRDENGSYTASGWTFASDFNHWADAIILAYRLPNRARTAIAIAELHVQSQDIFNLLIAPANTKLTWKVSVPAGEISSGSVLISAWAFDTNKAIAYRLKNYL